MTVEELIERLKQFDPKLPVTVWNGAARNFGEFVVMQDEDVSVERQEPHYDSTDDPVDGWVEQPGLHVRIG